MMIDFVSRHHWSIGLVLFQWLMVLCLGYIAFNKISTLDVPVWNQRIVFSGRDYLLFFICCVLSFVNWSLESLKWQYLLKPLRPINFVDSAKEVLIGHTSGVLTPGRIGEYAAKGLLQPKESRWMGLLLHAWGSFGLNGIQLLVAGGVLLFWQQLFINLPFQLGSFVLFAGLLHIGIFLVPNILVSLGKIFQKIPWLRRWVHLSEKNSDAHLFSSDRKVIVILLSSSRYLVYLLQFVLLLYLWVPGMSIETGLCGAALVYGLQTLMPLSPFLSFVARGELALLVFQAYGGAWSSILLASLMLWIMNVFVPALVGSLWAVPRKDHFQT